MTANASVENGSCTQSLLVPYQNSEHRRERALSFAALFHSDILSIASHFFSATVVATSGAWFHLIRFACAMYFVIDRSRNATENIEVIGTFNKKSSGWKLRKYCCKSRP